MAKDLLEFLEIPETPKNPKDPKDYRKLQKILENPEIREIWISGPKMPLGGLVEVGEKANMTKDLQEFRGQASPWGSSS